MKKHGITIAVWIFILAAWTLITSFKILSPTLIPSPIRVASTFKAILISGYNGISFWTHLGMTLFRLFSAILLAILTGVPLGMLSGSSNKIYQVVDSLIQFYRPIPPLAYYTLLILWFGIGETSKIILLYLAALAPIYISTVEGVHDINPEYLFSASSLGANKKYTFFHVVFPASLPLIFTGIRTAIGVTFSTLVSAEMVASTSGIGWMVIDASKYLKSDVIFLGIILLGIIGYLIDVILKRVQERFIYWS